MIKALLFDFGGTLDTDGVHWSEKFWEIYQRLRILIPKPEYEKAYVFSNDKASKQTITSNDSLLKTLEKQVYFQMVYLTEHRILKASERSHELSKKVADECYGDVLSTLKRAKTVLDRLKREFALGLVSNFSGNLAEVLIELGLSGYFQTVIDSTLVGVSKPDPEIFRIALRDIKTEACETAMVGDSYDQDIVPSKKISCATIWLFKRSWKEATETSAADFVIRSITEIPRLVKTHPVFG